MGSFKKHHALSYPSLRHAFFCRVLGEPSVELKEDWIVDLALDITFDLPGTERYQKCLKFVRMYFGILDSRGPLKLHEIGQEFSTTKEYIRQSMEHALWNLRRPWACIFLKGAVSSPIMRPTQCLPSWEDLTSVMEFMNSAARLHKALSNVDKETK